MSAGYSTQGWTEFFLCAGGAAAALSGLIFVGVSVNIRAILERDKAAGRNLLTGRALEALVALLNVLVVSIVALTPAIPRGAFAAFVLVVALESAIAPTRAVTARFASPRVAEPVYAFPLRVVLAVATTIAFVLAGITYASQSGGGLWWLPVAFVLAIVVAAVNAWMLLIEVVR